MVKIPPFSHIAMERMKDNELIHQIYNTLDEPDTWPTVLVAMAKALDSTHVFLLARTGVKAQPFAFVETGFDHGYFDLYQQYYYQHDIWTQGLINQALNQFHGSHQVCDDRDYLRSEIYNDFAKVEGIRHSIGCLIVNHDQGMFAELGFMRDEAQGHYEASTRGQANALVRHLQQVLGIAQRLHQAQVRVQDFQQLLDNSQDAILICNEQDVLLQSNQAGELLLSRGEPICLNAAKQLLFMDSKAQFQFAAAKIRMDGVAHAGGDECFMLHSQQQVYRVKIQPWLHAQSNALGVLKVPALMLTFQLVRITAALNIREMMVHFGFTKAEAEVTERLCQGFTIKEISVSRNVSLDTVRQQVKICLHKAQCRNQLELVRKILLTFPA